MSDRTKSGTSLGHLTAQRTRPDSVALPGSGRRTGSPTLGSARALVAVKAVHTLAWFSIEACVVYLLAAGILHRTDRRAAIAGAVVAGETVLFAANGFRCPLSDVAESLGADRGSVTDLYLPLPIAHALPALHVPFLIAISFLHGRNLQEQRASRLDRHTAAHREVR